MTHKQHLRAIEINDTLKQLEDAKEQWEQFNSFATMVEAGLEGENGRMYMMNISTKYIHSGALKTQVLDTIQKEITKLNNEFEKL